MAPSCASCWATRCLAAASACVVACTSASAVSAVVMRRSRSARGMAWAFHSSSPRLRSIWASRAVPSAEAMRADQLLDVALRGGQAGGRRHQLRRGAGHGGGVRRLGDRDVRILGLQLRLGLRDGRASLRDRDGQIRGVDLQQRVAGLDRLVFEDVDVRDGSGDARADVADVAVDLRVVGLFEVARVQPVASDRDRQDPQRQQHDGAAALLLGRRFVARGRAAPRSMAGHLGSRLAVGVRADCLAG